MAKRSDLEPLIIDEWLRQQPTGQRTENDLLAFYGRLQHDNPRLLSFGASADKYQVLTTILRSHIEH